MERRNHAASNMREPRASAAGVRRGSAQGRRAVDCLLIAAGFLLLTPLLSTHRVTDFMIFCIFVMSFDLLYGYMGRLSFGHMLFLGTGAYACGLFAKYASDNLFLAILAGILAASALGVLIGLIVVRATGACFSLMNLAFNQIGFFLVLSPLRDITRGEDGFGVRVARLGLLDFANPTFKYWFVLGCLLLVFQLLKRVTASPYGILIRSIKEDETRVRFLGYNTFVYKWLTFVLAAGVAGLAGTLSALNYNFVNPNSMDVHSNVGVVFASLIGGAGNLYGALVGGVAYMLISNFLPLYIQRWEMFLGFSLLIIVFKFRKGVWGNVQGAWERLRKVSEVGLPVGGRGSP